MKDQSFTKLKFRKVTEKCFRIRSQRKNINSGKILDYFITSFQLPSSRFSSNSWFSYKAWLRFVIYKTVATPLCWKSFVQTESILFEFSIDYMTFSRETATFAVFSNTIFSCQNIPLFSLTFW